MSDPRLTPSNGRVACVSLRGAVAADHYVEAQQKCVIVPISDLRRAPDGPRDRQVLLGETVSVFEDRDGWSFVRTRKDQYCGYLDSRHLGVATVATHRISAPSSHIYEAANFKSRDVMALSFASQITVTDMDGQFAQTPHGFVPRQHITGLDTLEQSPMQVARWFLGTPYLWGGNSRLGIDCSGLVQAALIACGIDCPGDSDLQAQALGRSVTGAPKAGDLLFWTGHVAMMADDSTLIHANAHHMAVALEPLDLALARISAQGDGEITRVVRL